MLGVSVWLLAFQGKGIPQLIAGCTREVDAATEAYLAEEHETPRVMFDYLYAESYNFV